MNLIGVSSLVRNPCKIKKAHILSPGDRGWGGGGNIEVVSKSKKMSFFVGIFFIQRKQKSSFSGFWRHRVGGGGNFAIVSRRQNMSFYFFASIPKLG